MWSRIKAFLGIRPKPVRQVAGPISIKSKGSQSLVIEDGKMVVYADDPEIKAPPGCTIEVRPFKEKK